MTTATRREELASLLSATQGQDIGFDDVETRNSAFQSATRRFAAISDAVTKLTACIALESGDRRDRLNEILTRAQSLKDREQAELDAATSANTGYSDAVARHGALLAAVASLKSALDLEPQPRRFRPAAPPHLSHG